MYIDKPPWLVHQEQTFSLDIDTAGTRLVTSSTSAVRVWNLAPILDPSAERDASVPRLLATLQDHNAPVNAARFSRDGKRIASGSDDACIMISELRPGPGASAFGGGAGAATRNVENWRPVQPLRGHSSNISDLAWSHDDTLLATSSVDSTVGVWAVSERPYRLVRFLSGHVGHVKGVAWDPLGRYLASQADDGVRVWAVDGWTQVVHIAADFKYSSKETFGLRLSWSPDGQWLAATNAYDRRTQSNHSRLFKRDQWDFSYAFVGHTAPVVAVRPNPRLFHMPLNAPAAPAVLRPAAARGEGQNGASAAAAAGAVSSEPSQLFAVCSLDKQFSVWTSNNPKALMVGSHVSKLGILDAAWTPDGYSLVVLGLDGSIASCRFTEAELGRPMSEAGMARHMESLYGDPSLRAADRPLIEGPEQLRAAAAAKAAAAAAGGPKPAPVRRVQPVPATVGGRGDALASRVMPQGSGAVTTTLPGGKKRIAPTPVGAPPSPAGPSSMPPPPKRLQPSPTGAAASRALVPAGAAGPSAAGGGGAAPATATGPAAAARGGGGGGGWALSVPPVLESLVVAVTTGEYPPPVGLQAAGMLEANNSTARSAPGAPPSARVTYSSGGARVWTDSLSGSVVCMAGTRSFSAVGLLDGSLLLYTDGGRRALPPIELGAPAVMMAADADFRLLVLTADGKLVAWDMDTMDTLHDVDVTPLLSSGVGIAHLRLSTAAAAPMVVLTNGRAHMYSPKLRRWLRVVDSAFQASLHNSVLAPCDPSGAPKGDLDRLLADTAAAAGPQSVPSVILPGAAPRRGPGETRAHLEALMAAALALGQPRSYERWLVAYVEFLAAYPEEQGRLDDLVFDLLGPVRWSPTVPNSPWEHRILGLPKRTLLRTALAQLARVPSLARYVRDVTGQLNDAEAFAAAEERAAAAAAAGGGADGGGDGGGGGGGDPSEGGGPGAEGGGNGGAARGGGGGGVVGFDLGPEPPGGGGGGDSGSGRDSGDWVAGGGSGGNAGGQEQRGPHGGAVSAAAGKAGGTRRPGSGGRAPLQQQQQQVQ